MLLNFCGSSKVRFRELNAYPSLPITLRIFWSYPNYFSVDRDFLGLVHQRQQDEYLLSELLLLVRGDKKTAAPNEGHIGRVQHRTIFNRQ